METKRTTDAQVRHSGPATTCINLCKKKSLGHATGIGHRSQLLLRHQEATESRRNDARERLQKERWRLRARVGYLAVLPTGPALLECFHKFFDSITGYKVQVRQLASTPL